MFNKFIFNIFYKKYLMNVYWWLNYSYFWPNKLVLSLCEPYRTEEVSSIIYAETITSSWWYYDSNGFSVLFFEPFH